MSQDYCDDPSRIGARLSTHEAVCADRYSGIMSRLGRLEAIIICAVGAMIVGMSALIITLALRSP